MPDPQSANPTTPPPPDAPVVEGQGDGGKMDHFRSILSRLSGGGTTAIDKTLQDHYNKRYQEAQLAKQQLQATANAYRRAQASGADQKTLDTLTQQYDIAEGNYSKIAGQGKESKPLIQQTLGVLRHVIGHPKAGQPMGAGTGGSGSTTPGQQPQSQGARPAATPAPPDAPDPAQGGTEPQGPTTPPPPSPSASPSPSPAMSTAGAADWDKQEQARFNKDAEYRDKLKAESDPRYHVNELKRLRDDLKDAFPEMEGADVEKAVLAKAGVTPKGSGHEMQPDFKDGLLVGVKDPSSNAYYTDPGKMPLEAKAIYDSAKKVEQQHLKDKQDDEDRRFHKQLETQSQALQNALTRADYVAAKKEVVKAQSTSDDAIDRQKTMHQNLDAALQGDQQAMLSLVANHIGMTLGAQKGARITRAVWDEATSSTPWLQKLEAKFDDRGYLSGVTLTPDQMRQMVGLADQKVDILKDHVGRVKEEYADDLQSRRGGKTPPPPKPGSSGSSNRIKVTAEDMANAK